MDSYSHTVGLVMGPKERKKRVIVTGGGSPQGRGGGKKGVKTALGGGWVDWGGLFVVRLVGP